MCGSQIILVEKLWCGTGFYLYHCVKRYYQNSSDSRVVSCILVDFEAMLEFHDIKMITCSETQDGHNYIFKSTVLTISVTWGG